MEDFFIYSSASWCVQKCQHISYRHARLQRSLWLSKQCYLHIVPRVLHFTAIHIHCIYYIHIRCTQKKVNVHVSACVYNNATRWQYRACVTCGVQRTSISHHWLYNAKSHPYLVSLLCHPYIPQFEHLLFASRLSRMV